MRFRVLFLAFCSSVALYAQNEDFASDRPGLSDAPDLIRKNSWQIATGFDISKYNHYGLYQLSASTLKYGISDRLEARMDFGLQYDEVLHLFGTNSPAFGLKALVFDQKKFYPKTAFILEYYPPPFASTQQPSGLGAEICFSHELTNGNSIYYNMGANWQDLKLRPVINYLVGYSFEFNDVWSSFVELYLYKKPGVVLNAVTDIGFTYQLNQKTQLDLSGGIDLIRPKGNFYFEGGLSYNF